MAKRTDIHRKGAIVPGEYTYVLSYSGAGANGEPSFGINCALDRAKRDNQGYVIASGEHDPDGHCCVVGLREVARVPFSAFGCGGSCTACGAWFRHGDVWKHTPSGEYIHLGHECASKYGDMKELSRAELERGRTARALATAVERHQRMAEREEVLAAHPNLENALQVDHRIVRDIRERFYTQRPRLSEAQRELVFKLAHEAYAPAGFPEAHVAAPEGRTVVRGLVVSAKWHDSDWGSTKKITVKVETPEGSWLCWCTAPAQISEGCQRGATVEFTATLSRGRDPHFAFGKRPSKARVLEPAAA